MRNRATPTPTRIPVLLYHRIAADDRDPFAVSPARFADHVEMIAASLRTPMTIGEIADGLRGGSLPRRPVAITFDDGFDDTPAAVDRLLASGLRATVYVTAGALDQPGSLSTEQLLALARIGRDLEIGAHSVTHPHLDAVPVARMRTELADSKRILEQLLGRRIETFAYPHGAYDARVREAAVDAGFRSAAAVKNAISHRHDDPLAVARYTVTTADSADRLGRILDGQGVPLAWRRARLRTRAARAVRRAQCRIRPSRPPAAKPNPNE
jgi:peptidoglycan/xylan/chitin deacetylase (PgdA/CDA1 family)